MMSSFMSGDERVLRRRKRPKETSSKAKTTRMSRVRHSGLGKQGRRSLIKTIQS
jgi:hypothetical protein